MKPPWSVKRLPWGVPTCRGGWSRDARRPHSGCREWGQELLLMLEGYFWGLEAGPVRSSLLLLSTGKPEPRGLRSPSPSATQ